MIRTLLHSLRLRLAAPVVATLRRDLGRAEARTEDLTGALTYTEEQVDGLKGLVNDLREELSILKTPPRPIPEPRRMAILATFATYERPATAREVADELAAVDGPFDGLRVETIEKAICAVARAGDLEHDGKKSARTYWLSDAGRAAVRCAS